MESPSGTVCQEKNHKQNISCQSIRSTEDARTGCSPSVLKEVVYGLLDHKDSQAGQEVTITLQYTTDWIGCGRWWVVGTERSHREAVATEIGLERFLCSVRLVNYQLELTSVWGHWTAANLVNKTNVANKGVSNTGWTIYCMHFIKIIKDSISFWYNTPISQFSFIAVWNSG